MNPVCKEFGHTWAVRIRSGNPVLICSTCNEKENR